jgi:hypothetical protein
MYLTPERSTVAPVCSMFARMSRYGPVAADITRHPLSRPAVQSGRSRHASAQNGMRQRSKNEQSSRLLICGFGVRVPGGAPALTWRYTRFGRPRGGRFGAMFAPRLLVSPDLVHRAGAVGPAPARRARLGCRAHPGMSPADAITQRDICRIAWLKGARPHPRYA